MSKGMETYLDTNRNTYKKSYTNTDTCLEHVVGKIDLGWIDVTQISFAQLSG